MTDTMTSEVVAEKDIGPAKRDLEKELRALRQTGLAIDEAEKHLADAKRLHSEQMEVVIDAWKDRGCPQGSFRMWTTRGGDQICTLSTIVRNDEDELTVSFEDELKL